MRVRGDSNISLVLILMAGASLVSMFATLRIDQIVHQDLYDYGLHFSARWAVPYWTMAGVVFGMGWFIILTSIGFELYSVLPMLHGRVEPETPIARQEPTPAGVPVTTGSIQVVARNNGTAPLTIGELWINDVKQTSVRPALPCTIQSNGEITFVVSTGVHVGRSYQVRLVSARGKAFTYTVTTGPREMSKTEAERAGEPEKKQAITTAIAVKKEEDELSEFRVLPEGTSVMTGAAVTRQRAEEKPKSE